MDSSTKSPIIVGSLCTGYGGIELGLKQIFGEQMRTAFYVEREAFACANLVAKIEKGKLDAAPIWTDIKTFNGKPFCGKVDIITAGFPCQPVSVAGKRLGAADERYIWPHIKRAIGIIRPALVFLENVPGLINLGLRQVLLDLEELGYRVETDRGTPTWGLFTAAECGAPHKRERLFILAYNHLADTETTERGRLSEKYAGGRFKEIGRYDGMWPARPGQFQYEWEEPRIVENPGKRRRVQSPKGQSGSKNRRIINSSGQGQAPQCLGRAADECTRRLDANRNRVDRLRLLGNGCVPAQAAKAFRYLMSLFEAG